jgi:glycosyltransferase involved in cell wall biosynthesis
MKTLTIGIPSYQRRESLLRLVRSLDRLAASSPSSWAGVDVVVVLDGSDDGSREALASYSGSLPLHLQWQDNVGLSGARNTCLKLAKGEIIWYLDDDMVPAEGAIDRHRQAHEGGTPSVLLGPCLVPDDLDVPPGVRQWWADIYAPLAAEGVVTRFDQFGVANASAPVELLRSVGGFDESFTGYGWEDYELGVRVSGTGAKEYFDAQAVAWHYTDTNIQLAFHRQHSIGNASAKMFRLHPELAHDYFQRYFQGSDHSLKLVRLLDRAGAHSARELKTIAAVAHRTDGAIERLTGRHVRLLHALAWEAAFFSGIAEVDRKFLGVAMCRPGAQVVNGQ